MKRDMDLVRGILLAYETDEGSPYFTESLKDYDEKQVRYHIEIMCDAGLLEAMYHPASSGPFAERPLGYRMTWFGHDFLDAARDDTRWKKAKGIMKQIGGATFDIMKQILAALMAEQMKQAMRINP